MYYYYMYYYLHVLLLHVLFELTLFFFLFIIQGEMSTRKRSTDGRVPLEEIPNLMRSLGYYPTERDIENMTTEVKYASYLVDGSIAETIEFDQFLRLYINHRPVFGISKGMSITSQYNLLTNMYHVHY